MKKWIIIIAAAFTMLGASGVLAQDSGCLVDFCILHPSDSANFEYCDNPDSVLVDTCSGSATFGEQYAKQWFGIIFEYYVIDLPQAPDDTDLEVSWTAIDTSFSTLRSAFSALELKYGIFYLKKIAPTFVDSTNLNSRVYSIRFEKYFCVDSVVKDLSNLPELEHYDFASHPVVLVSVHNIVQPEKPTQLYAQLNRISRRLTVKCTDNTPLDHLSIFNETGETVFEKNILTSEFDIDVHALSDGFYIVRSGGMQTKVLITR